MNSDLSDFSAYYATKVGTMEKSLCMTIVIVICISDVLSTGKSNFAYTKSNLNKILFFDFESLTCNPISVFSSIKLETRKSNEVIVYRLAGRKEESLQVTVYDTN